jgi:hypothetical protein
MSDDFHTEREVTARKQHTCGECRECIPKGARYLFASGKWWGSMFKSHLCLTCAECRPDWEYSEYEIEYEVGEMLDWYKDELRVRDVAFELPEPAPVDDKTLPMFGIENAPRVVVPKRSAETLRLCNLLRAELKLPPLVVNP